MAKKFDNLSRGSKNMGGFDALIKGEQKVVQSSDRTTKDINLKGVPVEIHKFLKIKATDDETTIAKLIIRAITDYYGLQKL